MIKLRYCNVPSLYGTKQGVFIDAPVKGVKYETSSKLSGTTNEKGEFQYKDDDQVTFSLDDIELGKALPDSDKKVKVTQFSHGILVAQLLQSLDIDTDANKIDISDITIPAAVKAAIKTKLEGVAGHDDILTAAEFTAIKDANTDKTTLPTNVITRADVLTHIQGQLGEEGATFSEADVKKKVFISSSIFTDINEDDTSRLINDRIIIFTTETTDGNTTNKLRIVEKKDDDNPLAQINDIPGGWGVSDGKINVGEGEALCTLEKMSENTESIDVIETCGTNVNIYTFLKPRSLSVDDLSGKTITYGDFAPAGELFTSSNDTENTLMLENNLILLAKGTLSDGTIVMLHHNDDTPPEFKGVDLVRTTSTSGGYTWESLKRVQPPETPSTPSTPSTPPAAAFTVTSNDFQEGQSLTQDSVADSNISGGGCNGNNRSPDISWSNPPAGTQSFAVTIFDLDADWWHWIVFDIPSTATGLVKNASADNALPTGSIQGYNTWGSPSFGGACPPSIHRYQLTVYALDKTLNLNIDPRDSNSLSNTEIKAAIEAAKLDSKMITSNYP